MFGGQAQLVAVNEEQLLPFAETMSFETAAAIPVNYLTAYIALIKFGHLQQGEKVLIHSCAGGVGTAAVQLALAHKAEVYGLTSSDEKIEYIRRQGVHHAINYKKEDFTEVINNLTSGKGVDIVLDSVGGPIFKRSLKLLSGGGRIICYGVTDMMASGRKRLWRIAWKYFTSPRVKILDLMQNNLGIYGLALNRFISDMSTIRPILEKILSLYSQGLIKPAISRIYGLDEISAAHAHLESGKSIGKLILNLNN
jgi:NADPH:quinone reductase-like Zn-dependent oxidoreductase